MEHTMTLYERIPMGYADPDKFGEPGNFSIPELKVALDKLIARRLPECIAWCGDELLVPCDDQRNYLPEDQEELDGFSFDDVVDAAFDELFEMSDAELTALLKGEE